MVLKTHSLKETMYFSVLQEIRLFRIIHESMRNANNLCVHILP